MAKYNYARYNVNAQYADIGAWEYKDTVRPRDYGHTGYTDYTYDSITNTYGLTGEVERVEYMVPSYPILYSHLNMENGKTNLPQILKWVLEENAGIWYARRYTKPGGDANIQYTRGSYSANVVAEDGTYPTNGKHTDGYWYVRGSLYNTAPTTPGAFSSPAVGTILKGGSTITLHFGASVDPDGDEVKFGVEASINGGVYEFVTNSPTNRLNVTIPSDKTKISIRWRVYSQDTKGAQSPSYAVSPVYTISHNTAPTITGADGSLGDKTTPFSVTYQANDVDTANALTVTEKLNGTTLRTLSNAPKNTDIQLNITKELFDALLLNSTNTIQIEVNDGNGGLAYRNYTFTKSNSAPIISGIDADLGVIIAIPSEIYQVSDNEGDAVTITEKINDMVIRTFEATSNTDYTITIPELEWFKLNLGQHTLKIEALDARGGKSIRTYTFTRADDKIKIELKTPFVTDMKASKLLISPTWVIPAGATAKVEACNNAYDDIPTWEDITNQVLINRHYNFTNAVKTATQWGINIRFTLEKGTATSQVILDGFGGAFE